MDGVTPATADEFDPALGSDFTHTGIDTGPGRPPVTLRLVEVVRRAGPEGGRQPFNLYLRGPTQPVLAQTTHPLRHPDLGQMELFLGPVAADPDGVTYEAVFN